MTSGPFCLRVPFTVGALFALLLTPAHADVLRPLADRFQISASADGNQGKPAIASDGTNFLVVWRDKRDFGTNGFDIYGARVSHDGEVLDPEGIPIATVASVNQDSGNQQFPSVAFDGANFMVAWIDGGVMAARVAQDGTVLDPEGVAIITVGDPIRMPSIAFDGTNYLVVWRTSQNIIRGARVSTDVVSLDGSDGFDIGGGYYPYVTFDGTNYLVVWHSGFGADLHIAAAKISTDGTVLDPGAISISAESATEDHSSVAFGGTNFLVVWNSSEGGDGYNGSVYGARVSSDGTVLDAPAFKIADYARGQVSVRVVFDGTDYLVVWQMDNTTVDFRAVDLYGRRVKPDGTLGEAVEIASIATNFGIQGFSPVVAYDYGRFLITWHEVISEKSGVYGRLFEWQESSIPDAIGSPAGPVDAGWSAVGSPTSYALHAVWGFDDAHVYAVNESDNGQLFKFGGDSWEFVTNTPHARKYGLWGFGPDDVWTTGWCMNIVRYDGAGVTDTNCLYSSLGMSIWGLDQNDFYAVGAFGSIVRLFSDGSEGTDPAHPLRDRVTQMVSNTTVDLHGVWGASANDVYAVGSDGVVVHYDGETWAPLPDVPSLQSLNAIWGSSDDDIFIVGDFGTILHFDGGAWTVHASGTTEHLTAIQGTGPSDIHAVGFHGVILHYDGVRWTREVSNTELTLEGVWGTGNSVWAVGDQGIILKKVPDADGDEIADSIDPDDDDDGMPDAYEIESGLNPYDASDADSDEDADGLSSLEEFQLGTAANDDDTDDDGSGDAEDQFPFNPRESLDTDEDGMGNNFETRFGLDVDEPADAGEDQDGDGASNLAEFEDRRNPRVNEPAVIQIINDLITKPKT